MNRTTLFKIEANTGYIVKMSEFLTQNPDCKWMSNLMDEPFKLALLIYEAGLHRDCYDVAAEVGCNWQTVKQIQSVF